MVTYFHIIYYLKNSSLHRQNTYQIGKDLDFILQISVFVNVWEMTFLCITDLKAKIFYVTYQWKDLAPPRKITYGCNLSFRSHYAKTWQQKINKNNHHYSLHQICDSKKLAIKYVGSGFQIKRNKAADKTNEEAAVKKGEILLYRCTVNDLCSFSTKWKRLCIMYTSYVNNIMLESPGHVVNMGGIIAHGRPTRGIPVVAIFNHYIQVSKDVLLLQIRYWENSMTSLRAGRFFCFPDSGMQKQNWKLKWSTAQFNDQEWKNNLVQILLNQWMIRF